MCLSNIWKDFTVDNMNKDGLSGYAYDFSIDYNTIEVSDIIDNDKYLLKKKITQNNICIDYKSIYFIIKL